MVHIIFDPSTVSCDNFVYHQQRGGGFEGDGEEGGHNDHHRLLPEYQSFFKGSPFQRGYGRRRRGRIYGGRYWQHGAGIGDILRSLWRILSPVLRKAGQAVGHEGLQAGERILDKISHGENLKEAVLTEGKRGLDNLLEKSGLPKQFGTGRKRGRKATTLPLPAHQMLIGREVKKTAKKDKSFVPKRKRIRADTFGFY